MSIKELRFPPPCKPWSINEIPATVRARIAQSKKKQWWRDAATWAAIQQVPGKSRRRVSPCNVQVSLPFTTNRRRDGHNYTGTVVKAIIDGLTIAGLWPDDNADHLTVLDPILVVGTEVIVTITPRHAGVVG